MERVAVVGHKRTQNLAKFTLRVGSTPTSATIEESITYVKKTLPSGNIGQCIVEKMLACPSMTSPSLVHRLTLYRRHRRDCEARHLEESRSGEVEERKKGWKKSQCPIFASGSLAGRLRRTSTAAWDWDQAKATAATCELAGSWNDREALITFSAVIDLQSVQCPASNPSSRINPLCSYHCRRDATAKPRTPVATAGARAPNLT
jgi:hypothetical protein